MWWKIAIGFVSGLVVGGVYIRIVDNKADNELFDKTAKKMAMLIWENQKLKAQLAQQ